MQSSTSANSVIVYLVVTGSPEDVLPRSPIQLHSTQSDLMDISPICSRNMEASCRASNTRLLASELAEH